MKTLNKRTKILLAIAGVVIVVIAAGVVILQPSGFGLFGTTTYPYLSPNISSIQVGEHKTLTVIGNPALASPVCTWSVSSGLGISTSSATSITIYGQWKNTASVTAKCNVGTVTHTLSVTAATPSIRLR